VLDGEQGVAVVGDESEAVLVERAIERDTEAFSMLYSLYFDRVYRYARLRLRNPADAEDVTAAVFLSAWRAIDRFSPKHETSFAGWLFRLAHNTVVDRYRRLRETVSLDGPEASCAEDISFPSPEVELEWHLTLAELHTALQSLTDEQREVVLLRFVEGLSAREVGDIMGKHEGTVRGMQFRAIEALRRALSLAKERHASG
jgi:RNA polymerase sigma-70 factor (ECF subfamily)